MHKATYDYWKTNQESFKEDYEYWKDSAISWIFDINFDELLSEENKE